MDASSGKVHIELQSHLNAEETVGAINAFETQARNDGIVIESYSMDNGSAFKSEAFRDHVSSVDQTTFFSGAGSHHHNGRAEVNVKIIMALARTMKLHAAIHWSDVADPTLWPMAVRQACWIWNHLQHHATGLSPEDVWSRTPFRLMIVMFPIPYSLPSSSEVIDLLLSWLDCSSSLSDL